MIFCVVGKPEDYTVHFENGVTSGLWETYGFDPDLFNLLSRVSPAMFTYEEASGVDPGCFPAAVGEDKALVETVSQEIDGESVRSILRRTTPREMVAIFKKHGNLAIHKAYSNPGDLYIVMTARDMQFRKRFRGAYSTAGKVVYAQFRSMLNPEEDLCLKAFVDSFITGFKRRIEDNV